MTTHFLFSQLEDVVASLMGAGPYAFGFEDGIIGKISRVAQVIIRNSPVYDPDEAHLAGSIIADFTDNEAVEYLRWMACNRPQRYAYLMTAFMERHCMRAKAAVV